MLHGLMYITTLKQEIIPNHIKSIFPYRIKHFIPLNDSQFDAVFGNNKSLDSHYDVLGYYVV